MQRYIHVKVVEHFIYDIIAAHRTAFPPPQKKENRECNSGLGFPFMVVAQI